VEFRVLFAERGKEGRGRGDRQWILSLDFLGQIKETVYGAESQQVTSKFYYSPDVVQRIIFVIDSSILRFILTVCTVFRLRGQD
jgi:hypothetical protein